MTSIGCMARRYRVEIVAQRGLSTGPCARVQKLSWRHAGMSGVDVPRYRLVRSPPAPLRRPPELDAGQRLVVEHPGGPLLVLAGPGTGKTTTLVEAAVARVRDGVPIEQLLMLTFSRRAAAELRARVSARLGGTVREPIARTFHSYAFGILRMAAVDGGAPPPRLLSGPEQDLVLRELIDGDLERGSHAWPVELRPALRTRGFAAELRDLLLRAVERGLTGPQLAELGRRQRRPDWMAAGSFLQQYLDVTALAHPGAWDPAELIQAAVDVLRTDPTLLSDERRRRRRIFVDEYQDTDPAQAGLLGLIGEGADEIVVVGDPDQSIYAFRGADASAVRDMPGRFGGEREVPVVMLRTCRRSGSALLAATRRIAARLPGPVRQREISAASGLPPGAIVVAVLRTAAEEAGYVAEALRRAHLEDGLAWSRMAVLVRSTRTTLAVLRRAMIAAGVPVAVASPDIPLAEQPAVAHLLAALHAVLHPDDLHDEAAEALLLGPIGGADALQLRRLRHELHRLARAGQQPGDDLVAAAVWDVPGAAVLAEHVRRPVQRVARVLGAGRVVMDAEGSAEAVLWSLWDASRLAWRWDADSRNGGSTGAAADRDLDAMVDLFDAAARFTDRLPAASPRDFYEHLMAQQVPGEWSSPMGGGPEAVRVLTAHSSKGLEWDLVCVAGVQEGSWPDLRRRGSLLGSDVLVEVLAGRDAAGVSTLATQLAEERRLFYVAVTRARRRLLVTAVSGEEEQPSRFLDELDPLDGPRPLAASGRGMHLPGLVAELRGAVCDPALEPAERTDAATELARLAAAGVPGAHPDDWWGLAPLSDDGPVADPAAPVPVSPSRIESFLRCELRSLLEQLGAREGDQIRETLGTLIHEVSAAAADTADLAELKALLDARWSRLDFGAPWLAEHQRLRARTMLAKLVAWLGDTRADLSVIAVERDFDVVVGDARLRGRVDRLERDRAGRPVVVDLKTGKSKPTPAELAVHPQLGAYQLAVQHDGFAGVATGEEPGGARLVQLGREVKKYEDQQQPPLGEQDDPLWIARQVAYIAGAMRGGRFRAIENSYCGRCDLKTSCPLMDEGRPVTR
jgi:superfamily I DNA/RNA helicase/RecB family exonuclease